MLNEHNLEEHQEILSLINSRDREIEIDSFIKMYGIYYPKSGNHSFKLQQ